MKTVLERILITLLLIFSLTSVSFIVYSANDQTELSELFERGNIELEKDLHIAQPIFLEIIQKYPNSKYASLSIEILAEKYHYSGYLEGIIQLYGIAKKEDIELTPLSKFVFAECLIFFEYFDETFKLLTSMDFESISRPLEGMSFEILEQNYYFMILESAVFSLNFEYVSTFEKKYLEKYPEDYEAFYLLALHYLGQNKAENAINYGQNYSEKVISKEV